MSVELSGATRVYGILGDPIAQVKSPAGITRIFAERGHDAVMIPMHVRPPDFDAFVAAAKGWINLDGLVFTIPHKFAAFRHADEVSERTGFLGSCNVMRRDASGRGWIGDMLDGPGFLNGLRAAGYNPKGKRALVVGGGGAGSAIALALVEAGVAELALHDVIPERRDALLGRLADRGGARLRIGSADPGGFDLVVNATPVGMSPGDLLPVEAGRLAPSMLVADVITAPEKTPLLEIAERRGCRIQTGAAMYAGQAQLVADFLLAGRR